MPTNIVEQLKSAAFLFAILLGILYWNEPAQAAQQAKQKVVMLEECVYPKTEQKTFYIGVDKPVDVGVPRMSFVVIKEENGYLLLKQRYSSKVALGLVKKTDMLFQDRISCEN